MSFLDNLDVEELSDGHEEHTGHGVSVDWSHPNEDGKVLVFCTECSWGEWGIDSRPIGWSYD